MSVKEKLKIFYAGLLISTIFFSTLQAEEIESLTDLSIEDLMNIEVTTASKKSEKISDAPGVMTVITEQDIKNFGAQNLLDVLHLAPGFQAISSHLWVNNVVSLRGDLLTHLNVHVLILLNGRPMRESLTGGVNFPVFTAFPIEMIDRIEIIRGPGSVLYGTNAFAGVINIITKIPSKGSEMSLSLGGGSFGSARQTASAGYAGDDFSFIAGFQGFQEKGWNFSAATVHPSPAIPDVTDSMDYEEKELGVTYDPGPGSG